MPGAVAVVWTYPKFRFGALAAMWTYPKVVLLFMRSCVPSLICTKLFCGGIHWPNFITVFFMKKQKKFQICSQNTTIRPNSVIYHCFVHCVYFQKLIASYGPNCGIFCYCRLFFKFKRIFHQKIALRNRIFRGNIA